VTGEKHFKLRPYSVIGISERTLENVLVGVRFGLLHYAIFSSIIIIIIIISSSSSSSSSSSIVSCRSRVGLTYYPV